MRSVADEFRSQPLVAQLTGPKARTSLYLLDMDVRQTWWFHIISTIKTDLRPPPF